jgi:hypothetical protein
LVSSLARPGGNVTGLSYMGPDLASKRLEIAHEAINGLARLAIMADSGASGAMLEMHEVQTMAGKLGLAVVPLEIQRREQITLAFTTLEHVVFYRNRGFPVGGISDSNSMLGTGASMDDKTLFGRHSRTCSGAG